MSETNGQGKSRLDRIEEIIERQERANETAHARFEEEDKRLLTAQILMNGAMQRLVETTQVLVDRLTTLELKMEETNGKLNALIETVDGIIRRPPPDSPLSATGH